ncbi:FAD-dependent oxidoreductase [candidate division WWE3 bacterium]|uniref:FAD-dependent oxidoreductase n=1 Tax=candidate division WWE3 bacterium TaxID=2053526 RepID=A0A7X9DLN2_UNCKA|nr:FAD-dependent oxidoreductase [candidate division WWE3 bacterium]
MFIRPQKFEAIVAKKDYLNPNTVELTLNLHNPNSIDFQSGQFVSLEVAENEYRAYSISSEENSHSKIRLLIEVSHSGKGADLVKRINVEEKITFIGPSGKFTLPNELPNKIVFIATGVGFAPFESMLHKLEDLKFSGVIEFFFGIRNPENLFKEEYLKKYSDQNNLFKYYLCFSQGIGRVTKVLPSKLDLSREKNTLFLICGNPNMIHEMNDTLIKNGINEKNILHEKFTYAAI